MYREQIQESTLPLYMYVSGNSCYGMGWYILVLQDIGLCLVN